MTRVRTPAGIVVLVAVLASGCGSGLPPITPSPDVPASPAAPTPTPVVDPIPELPPDVSIAADGGTAAVGDLGTFSWAGLVSDSPWILGRAAVTVPASGALEAEVAGPFTVREWTAQWALVVAGEAQPGADAAANGFGLPIVLRPPRPGAWSLRLEVGYADVGRANWFWRVEVAP